MKKVYYLIGLLYISLLSSNYVQSQTAMFGTNPHHTGVYDSHFPSDMAFSLKWKFKTNGKIFSTAVVVNDVVFFGSNDSCLYAVNADGSLKWKFISNGMICSSPAIKDNVVYFNNYGATFYAVDINSGTEIWSYKTDDEMPRTGKGLLSNTPKDRVITDPYDFYLSSPQIVDSIVYFGSGSNVYAFNLNNSSLIWKFKAADVVHSTPAIQDGMIYFGCWDSKLYALNASTGEQIWKFQTGVDPTNRLMEGIQSSPSVIDSFVIFGSRDANVYAIHAKTGKILWHTGFSGSWMPSSFAVYNDTIFTGSSDAFGFFALSKTNGEIYYKVNTMFSPFSTPAISNGTAFIGVMNGSLLAIDLTTKKIKCEFLTDGRILNPLNAINSNGTLNMNAFTSAFNSPFEQDKEFVRILFTAGGIVSSPVIDKNVIFFGSTDSCFYAICDSASY